MPVKMATFFFLSAVFHLFFIQQSYGTVLSDITTNSSPAKIQVNVLRISSGLEIDYGILTALERVQANTTLNSIFDVVLYSKVAKRVLSKGVGPILRILLESLGETNQTFAFLIGPDFTAETMAAAQITPLYNLVSMSASVTSNMFSDKGSFPLFFRSASKSANFVRAFSSLVAAIKLEEMATLTFNEPYLVDGIRALEQEMSSLGIKLQYSGIFDLTNRQEIMRSILNTRPQYIAMTLFGQYEPAFVCDLFKSGLMPPETTYIAVGTFGTASWWLPKWSKTSAKSLYNCTMYDMQRALNGSLFIDTFYDDTRDAAESNKTKIGGANGWQLNERFRYYENILQAGTAPGTSYGAYDLTWSAFDALYRTAQTMRLATNNTLKSALSSHYQSEAYKQYMNIFQKELRATKFYGLTIAETAKNGQTQGDFAYDTNQDRLIDLRVYQFQPDENTFGIQNIGNSSGIRNTTTLLVDRLRFATPDGTAPHVWYKAQAAQADSNARDRNVIIAVVVVAIGLIVLMACAAWFRKRRQRMQSDTSWIIPFGAITVVHGRRTNDLNRSFVSTATSNGSSVQSMPVKLGNSMCSMTNSTGFTDLASTTGSNMSGVGRLTIGAMSEQHIWMRKFPAIRIQRQHQAGNGLTTAVQLNAMFPQAKFLHKLVHQNINRFFGMTFSIGTRHNDESEGLIVFEYASKGSLRDLLRNETFALDAELKCSFVYDIACAVQFVHSQPATFSTASVGFLHCNNIVLDKKFTAKLTDYEFWTTRAEHDFAAVSSVADLTYSALEQALTRAPEFLVEGLPRKMSGKDNGGGKIARADIYAFGMTVAEITTRALPYCSEKKVEVEEREQLELAVQHVIQLYERGNAGGKVSQQLSLIPISTKSADSNELRQLAERCTSVDPFARPTANSVVKAVRKLPSYSAGGVVENLIDRLHSYASNLEGVVAERTAALAEEMALSERLLLQILPPSVARKLKSGQAVDPETYEEVSIYFSDIVEFTAISAESTPMQVVILLNSLYTMFDSVLENFDVYKVETIGDAYMVASGLPIRNGSKHLAEIASMALKLLREIHMFEVPHSKDQCLLLRIGLHVGPCVAGVVGSKMPRYCLFGDTVNTASRMETTGEASKIHISTDFKVRLENAYSNAYAFIDRGLNEVKGKGSMHTFWLANQTTVL